MGPRPDQPSAPVTGTSPAALMPATAAASSLSDASPVTPTAPSSCPPASRTNTPPGTERIRLRFHSVVGRPVGQRSRAAKGADRMDKVLYQDTVPYEAPSALSALSGPVSGSIELPINVHWGPVPDLRSVGQRTAPDGLPCDRARRHARRSGGPIEQDAPLAGVAEPHPAGPLPGAVGRTLPRTHPMTPGRLGTRR